MKKVILSIAAILMLMPSAAMACSVAPWPGDTPPTPEMIAEHFLFAKAAFFGKVGIRDVTEEQETSKTTYTMEVLKQYAGNRKESFTAYTDNISTCAFGGQNDMVTLLYIPEGETEPYKITMLSNYFYGVSETEMESYLDAKQASGE